MNGKGKEYDEYNNELIYEGEYKKGRKNGKGKEYFIDGKLKSEGEYLNDEIWNGTIYEIDSDNTFKINSGNGYVKK